VNDNRGKKNREKINTEQQTTRKKRKKIKPRYGRDLSLLEQFKSLAIMTGMAIFFIALGVWLTRDNGEVNTTSNNNDNPTIDPNNSSFPSESSENTNSPNPEASLLPALPTNAPVNTPPPEIQEQESIGEPIYRVVQQTKFTESKRLSKIVTDIVSLAQKNNLNTQALSITLIDVNTGEIAGYQQQTSRFPASVVKMFWLVALYGQIALDRVPDPNSLRSIITKTIKDSDNESASEIVDLITTTKSFPQNSKQTQSYQEWVKNRQWLNRFFANSELGYQNLNITQKTFPIPKEKMLEPTGYDLQIRGNDPNQPIRNKISTEQAAKLMYDIATGNAIDSNYSKTLFDWLKWDLATEKRKAIDPNTGSFNPIRTFFGEALEKENVIFASKAGWTSQTRQEVAYIATRDGKTKYILAVFAEDKGYAKNIKIFPQISQLVYQRAIE
jgi:hypothetical protein